MYDTPFGKAAAPLILMLEELPQPELHYIIHVDNLFTGLNLFSYLRFIGYGAIGTMRENRVPNSCTLMDEKHFSKRARGHMEYVLERNSGVLLVRWMDYAVVTMASTSDRARPIGTVKRYSQKEKRHILVNRPQCIAMYNKNMGGTDLMDPAVANYRIGIGGKKLYWPIFTWLVDVSVHNAWVLYRKNNNGCTMLIFRREVAQVYLTRYANPPKTPGLQNITRQVLEDMRYDHTDHSVAPSNRRRCTGENCESFGRTICKKCNVGLCVGCFAQYHTK
ncbi:hypothetical protein JTB14_014293 [Gonioctena quinquepunctata]|nr:hypothetical protein JTB14_014293 [Gonioctena quinquepunctata]